MCCASVEAIKIANEQKIHRIELCQNLDVGGITPSVGLFYFARDLDINTHVLVRPRSGGFFYSADEKKIMLKDIEFLNENGANGLVIGALNEDFSLDVEFLKEVKHHSSKMELTFHRAFDEVMNWKKVMDLLVEIGFKRILTSGRVPNIKHSYQNFKDMISFSNGRIEIMPGGGVNAENAVELIKELNINSIHFSGTSKKTIDDKSFFSTSSLEVDEQRVHRILTSIRSII